MKRYALIGLLSVLLSIMLSFEAYAQTFVTLTYRGATRVYGQKRIDDSKEMESILQLVQNGQPLESGVNIDVRNGGPVIELLVEDEQNGVLDFTLYTIYPGIPENVGCKESLSYWMTMPISPMMIWSFFRSWPTISCKILSR